jgi:hypothetical protein
MRAIPRLPAAGLVLSLAASVAFAQAVGDEFQVNTFTFGHQQTVHFGGHLIASDASGNFVVAWVSDSQDGSGVGVFGQRYDSAGTPIGSEFQINSATTAAQVTPSVASDAAGDFVVVWSSFVGDGDQYGIVGQRYDNAGGPLGSEFQVNTIATHSQRFPSLASDSSGNFVAVWGCFPPVLQPCAYEMSGQRYDSGGAPLGGEFRINSTSSGQKYPSIASAASGNFVVVWQTLYQDGHAQGIFGQRFDSAGAPLGSEFQINSYTSFNQQRPSVSSDAAGNFVVVWESYRQDGSGYAVAGQRFDSLGAPQGGEFLVNTFSFGAQQNPSVASDAVGNFLVTWASDAQDGSGWGVFAQRYDGSGAPQGDEFQVNTFITSYQQRPSVGAVGENSFVVVWESFGQDGSGYGVFGRRLSFATADTTPPEVTVVAPNGGERVFTGTSYTVRWNASDDVALDFFDAAYSVDGGASYNPMPGCTGVAAPATSCDWAAPGPPAAAALVRVTATDTSANTAADVSDAPFTIVAGTPFITVTSPTVAGVVWKVGDSKGVKFDHNLGTGQAVLVELNRDYPSGAWQSLGGTGCGATTHASNSTCMVTVANPPTAGATARIRATWAGNGTVTDVSDNGFEIQGRVTVKQPNTTLTWPAGSTREIKWKHTLGPGSSFDIAIDRDGDFACESPIASGVAAANANGSYIWLVSGSGSSNRICVTNAVDPGDADISDVPFTITP